jgi:hypothetical protein
MIAKNLVPLEVEVGGLRGSLQRWWQMTFPRGHHIGRCRCRVPRMAGGRPVDLAPVSCRPGAAAVCVYSGGMDNEQAFPAIR